MTFFRQLAALIASLSVAMGLAVFGPSLSSSNDELLNAEGAPEQLAFDDDQSNGDPGVPDAVSGTPSEATQADTEITEAPDAPEGAFDLQPVTPVVPPNQDAAQPAAPAASPTTPSNVVQPPATAADPTSPNTIARPPTTAGDPANPTTAGGQSGTTPATNPTTATTGSNSPQAPGTAPTTTTNPTTSATSNRPTTAGPTTAAPTTAAPTTAAPTTAAPTTAAPTTAAPTTAAPTTGTQPDAPVNVGRLLFSEDFNGSTLDTSIWEPAWFTSSGFSLPINGNEDSCFHPKQVSQRDGSLVLEITAETDPNCKKKDGQGANYVGGLINSRNSFTFSYGYAEARIHLSASNGRLHNWPAFWHNGANWPATGEVDILEGLSSGQPCTYYHFANSSGAHGQDGSCVDWADPGGWHTFAANREPGLITFYFDGVEVFRTTQFVTGDPHYLILNYTTDESFGIVPDTEMLVDYVRVWEN